MFFPSLSPCFNLNFKTSLPPSLSLLLSMYTTEESCFFSPKLIFIVSLVSPFLAMSEFSSGSLPSVVNKIESYALCPTSLFNPI